MPDPLRHDDGPPTTEAARESRIEELLLTGLDHYFTAQYERAIGVWTRVLFLDRGHARARAYIERARRAIGERQREGEELLQTGAAAFSRGDTSAARTLLTSAVEHGAPAEEALALLDRLDRLTPPDPPGQEHRGRPVRAVVTGPIDRQPPRTSHVGVLAFALGSVLTAGALILVLWWSAGEAWRTRQASPAPPAAADAEPLPVPAASDVWLNRARTDYARGRLRDALDALDAIRVGDARRQQADDLRATIQRDLLAASRAARGAASRPPATTR